MRNTKEHNKSSLSAGQAHDPLQGRNRNAIDRRISVEKEN